jgi:hypothetical protein
MGEAIIRNLSKKFGSFTAVDKFFEQGEILVFFKWSWKNKLIGIPRLLREKLL